MVDHERVGLRTKFAFGVGAISEGATIIGYSSFSMLFYNQVLKVPGSLVGLAAMIAIILDAMVDPLIGSISDRWRSKLGRRHPFLFAAPIPAALSFYFIFQPPSGLSQYGLFAWLTIWTVLLRQSMALFTIPHLALGAELSPSYTQRSKVMSWNSILGWVGSSGVGYFGWSYFFAARNGVDQRFEAGAYHSFGLSVALVAAASILVSALFTLDQVPHLPKAPNEALSVSPIKTLVMLFRDIRATLRNRNYRALVWGLLFLSASLGIYETLGAVVGTYYWGLTPSDLSKYSFASAFGFGGAFFFAARLHGRFDKRPMIITGIAINVLASTTPLWLRLLGLMPANGSKQLLPVLLCFFVVSSLGFSLLMISAMSALADVADEHELESGLRQEGIFYASRIFFSKAINGLGHAVAGVMLDVIKFPQGSRPGAVPETVIKNLGISTGLMMLIPSAIAIAFYAGYNIDKRTHARIREQLAARRLPPRAEPIAPAGESALLPAAQN